MYLSSWRLPARERCRLDSTGPDGARLRTDERKRCRSVVKITDDLPRLLIVHLFNGNGPRTI
jgi:hypothetical protein